MIPGKENKSFNKIKLRQVLEKAYEFINSLEKDCRFPNLVEESDIDDKKSTLKPKKRIIKPGLNVKQRLHTLEEIQEKLQEIRGRKMKNIQETMYKKNLKTRLHKQLAKEKKKQEKLEKKNKKNKIFKGKTENQLENKNKEANGHTVFNKESTMVFNKINFSELGNKKKFNRKRKNESDSKILLEGLKKSKLKLDDLEKSGETLKVQQIKEKQMWTSALKRSEGVRVKDDESLLKRSIRKEKEIKNRHKKKWNARVEATEKMKEGRQKKRQENIAAKKKEKKTKKMKKAVKRGRHFE